MTQREIKFRAYIEVGGVGRMFTPNRLHYFAEDTKYSKKGLSATCPVTSFVSYDVMQYTGMKDRNGVEIYEGDILSWTYYGVGQGHGTPASDAVIWYNAGSWGLQQERHATFGPLLASVAEVIGNIYENPDLLTKASATAAQTP